MIDEAGSPQQGAQSTMPSGDRVGFCQECGRPLTGDTLRRVGNGVFCEPCASNRQTSNTSAGWQAVPPASSYPSGSAGASFGAQSTIPGSDEPNPVLAGVLGLIPGVGAMYNGQYAKGALHLVVFVILLILEDNLSWAFGWFVAGWIFYQAFEAYHTAKARRDGLPLPNPFGWNDIGERLGFRNWSGPAPSVQRSRPASASVPPEVAPVPPVPVPSVPAANPYLGDPPATAPDTSEQAATPPFANVPYTPTFTGPAQPAGPEPSLLIGARRFPVGALWLIALGVIFLLGNLLPGWQFSGRWLVPVLLGMLSVWTAIRRLEDVKITPPIAGIRPNLIGALVTPSVLLTIAVLLALQNAGVLAMRRTWPMVLVVWGALLLLQRATDPLFQTGPSSPTPSAPPPSGSGLGAGPLGL